MEYDSGLIDRRKELPEGSVYCSKEIAAVTLAGIGADPRCEYNLFGGEIQVKPCPSEWELINEIDKIINAVVVTQEVSWGTSIHVHVRIPALLERPDLIKHIVRYSTKWWPEIVPLIYHDDNFDLSQLPKQSRPYYHWAYGSMLLGKLAVYDEDALARMEACDGSVADIACALHNREYGDDPELWKNEWQDIDLRPSKTTVMRPAVNMSHLAMPDIETIEFRGFMASTDLGVITNMVCFPLQFLRMALMNDPDPLRIARGVQFQDNFGFVIPNDTAARVLRAASTTLYFNGRPGVIQKIHAQLLSGQITIADLNYPQYWIDRGFQ